MQNEFIAGRRRAWSKITQVCTKARGPSWIAVAYFGKGAAKMLPLRPGSRLVVDASLNAVQSGVTHPDDLSALWERKVRVYSSENLHAKIYIFGKRAFIGSANASDNSANKLLESVLITSERRAVRKAKEFVESLAIPQNELGPEALADLQKKYRPPVHSFGEGNLKSRQGSLRANSRVRVVHLENTTFSEHEEKEISVGRKIAKRRSRHQRSWVSDEFKYPSSTRIQHNDRILVVTTYDRGKQLVEPIATVIYVRRSRNKSGKGAFVFYERKNLRCWQLKTIAERLGPKVAKKLRRSGLLSAQVSDQLNRLWPD